MFPPLLSQFKKNLALHMLFCSTLINASTLALSLPITGINWSERHMLLSDSKYNAKPHFVIICSVYFNFRSITELTLFMFYTSSHQGQLLFYCRILSRFKKNHSALVLLNWLPILHPIPKPLPSIPNPSSVIVSLPTSLYTFNFIPHNVLLPTFGSVNIYAMY